MSRFIKHMFSFVLFFFSCCICAHDFHDLFCDPIERAMVISEKDAKRALRGGHWKTVKRLYDEHIVKNPKWSETPRIPKIIHHIWLGSPVPEVSKAFIETWKKYHPDWEFMLWTEKEIDEFELKNRDLYDETPNYGAKSDIARYEILYHFGGLYVDTDFECVKPFDVLHYCCDFYSGAAAWDQVLIYCGLIAAAPGHPILKECVDSVRSKGKKKETHNQIQDRTGPQFLTRCFFRAIKKYKGPAVIFPAVYFYPWPHYEANNRNRDWIMRKVKPETFAIHHWHVSWAK